MKNRNSRLRLNIFILVALFGITFSTFSSSTCSAQSQATVAGYSALIQQADQALAGKDYPSALLFYGKATLAKPELTYAAGKVSEINKVLNADPDLRARLFEDLIIEAESRYNQKNYAQAKTQYQKALVMDPAAQYPKDRLAQISAIYTDPSDQSYYEEAVANGDKALSTNDFEKAILFYETALAVKPNTKAVKDKITNARKQQADSKIRDEQAQKIIAGADKLLVALKRTEARVEYQKALDITPNNEYARLKIQEIDKFSGDKKALQDTYDKVIELADQFYINRDFANARLKYQEALKAKPEARYPKEMLEKTKTGESLLQSDQQKYDAALAGAESLFSTADYEAALIGYKSALAIKPTEVYPKTKITDIEKLIGDRTSRKDAYDIAIKNGDQALEEKKYEPALVHYRNALSLLPGEKYPTLKIEEITATVALQKTTDENFRKSVAEADLLFKATKYAESIVAYTKALGFKPTEAYPQQKIDEANLQLDKNKSKDENYASAIASADNSLSQQKYDDALSGYKQALAFKPAEKYPKDKTDEITKILAKQKADADRYALALANGEKALTAGNFSLAITSFKAALAIKPGEQYPQEKIAFITAQLDSQQKTNDKYTAAINTGDRLLAGKEYDLALVAYNDAAGLKPAEKYPSAQITKINKLLGDQHSADENYKQAITEGDKNLNDQKLSEALTAYKRALSVSPAETYPKAQVEKINVLLAEQKKLAADYLSAITLADGLFTARKYDEAIPAYQKALTLKPTEKYPTDKIAEAEKQLADLKALQDSYDKAIADADKYLSDKDFANSLASYKSANLIKPAAAYPKQKITEVQAILDKGKAEGQRYTEAIALADKLFSNLKYGEALGAYQQASGIKPLENYPQEQLVKINQLLADQKKTDEDYQKSIADADIQFKAGKYDEARSLFTNAGLLKPIEKLPKDKIAEIDGIVTDLKNKEQSFAKHISEGDAYFSGNKYNEAITSYNSALKIKPSETYPKDQVDKINVLLAGQKKLDADYLASINSADGLLTLKKYDEAIAAYRKALAIKPSEKYPADKIAEAEKQLADLKAMQDSYDKAVADADKFLSDKDFDNALASYKSAVQIKPAEVYPKQKITEVQAILDKDKAEGQRYQEAIAQADKLFADRKYSVALEPYQRASGIKATEKYPQDQVVRINQLLAEQKKLDNDYQELLTNADIQLKAEKYNEARGLFTNAATLKPSEKLPKDKIAEIDAVLAEILNKEQTYAKAISEGDQYFSDKKYTEALSAYTAAIAIKPTENYPKTQIEKTNNLIAGQKKLDEDYQAILTLADQFFEGKKYTEALAAFRKALALKPSEKYPSDKIAEAEKQLADLKALQDSYDKAVAEGDRKMAEKDYANALAAFKNAFATKPAESYPATKITEIQLILDKQAAANSSYQEALALADKFFAAQKFREALEPYQRASTIKPGEKHPQEQIVKINELLAEQKKTDDDYQILITDAGNQFKAGKFTEALGLYTHAGTLKPAEKLPVDKIAEINGIIADLKLKDENYTKAINAAAEFYIAKNRTAAVKLYEEAQTLKPGERYPVERIAAINAEIKAIDDSYSKAVVLGDSKLASKNLMEALNAYQYALEIKPAEEYPKTKIAGINSDLAAQKEELAKMYASYVTEGDQFFASKDYAGARSAFTKASGIKPDETYPKQRITEINKIVEEIELTRKAEYNKALGEADKLYNTKIFDQAIDAYESAANINPGDPYPVQQINKIRKYMADHSIQDLFSQTLLIPEGNEKKFTFSSIEPRLRKNNYILLKARSTGKTAPKVYLNYGKDGQKNGGIVLRSLDKNVISDYLIRISVQDKWYREDNNWISLFVETGDIEITKVQIAAGDE